MSWLEALILGIVQGLTEFLPVSSSGHLEMGSVLLDINSSDNLLFAVIVHFATALSTLVVLRTDIKEILAGLVPVRQSDSWQFVFLIMISMIPVGVIGVFFQDEVEQFFANNMTIVGSMLLVTAVLLTLTHFYQSGEGKVTPVKAFVIGVAQAIAILPGISRSGATISTALLLGVDRSKAAQFSFLMVIVPIVGAVLLKFYDFIGSPEESGISSMSLMIGFLAAFLSGYLACKWMVKLVTQGRLLFFGIYCALVGIIAILSQVI